MKSILRFISLALYPYLVIIGYIIGYTFKSYNVLFNFMGIFWIVGLLYLILLRGENWTSSKIVNYTVLVKFIHVPMYVMLFVLSIISLIISLIPITFFVFILDCMFISISGILGVLAVKNCYDEGLLSKTELIVHSIFQFIFCLDLINILIVKNKISSRLNEGKKFV